MNWEWERAKREIAHKHLSGELVREAIRDEWLTRVNPLVKRGSRRSIFRPSPGTPVFRQYLEEARLERTFRRERRAEKAAVPLERKEAS
jgi:hypothetical protein